MRICCVQVERHDIDIASVLCLVEKDLCNFFQSSRAKRTWSKVERGK